MRLIRTAALLVTIGALLRPHAAAGQGAAASQLNGYLTLATGYWNRGLAQTDDGLAVQLGADYQHRSGFFVGGGLADVDYAIENERRERREPRELELNTYVGYHRRTADWSWTANLAKYLYPEGPPDYDYTEVSASVGFRNRIFFSTVYTDDLFSRGSTALNNELAMTFPLAWNMELGAALGRVDVDGDNDRRFTHWNVGVSKVARQLVLDLRYYDNTYDLVTVLGDPASRYVLSVSYAFRGKRPKS